MTESPFISILIPAYNPNEEFFKTCLDSLINQTDRDFEIIISDDGSGQQSADLFDAYARKHDFIKVLHSPNEGVSAARNKAILQAKADWILFVDADDWLEPDAIERLRGYLEQTACDMLLFGSVKEYAERQGRMNYGLKAHTSYDMTDFSVKEKLYRRAMSTPNSEGEDNCVIYYSWDKVFSRKLLVDNELTYPLGITNSEDKVFILRCFEKINALYVVDDVLYHYRINSTSASKKYSEKADAQRIKLTGLLEQIALRMDEELAAMCGQPGYHRIYDEFMRFCFGIISDVFNYKYYHPDFPRDKRSRKKEVKAFLNTDPFKKSIRYVRYSELSTVAKIKKLLLTLRMPTLFYKLKNRRMKRAGEIPMSGQK